jgi:hypothetical protein
MALPPTIALFGPVLPYQDFGATPFRFDFGYHFGPFDDWLANGHALFTRNKQYSVKLNCVANLIWQLLNTDGITFTDAILLATSFYYGVH